MARKDLLTRLADAGEDAIGRLGEAPGMDRVVGFANSTRDRLDELTRRARGVEELERRVARLEKRLAELSGTKSRSKSRTSSAAKPRSTAGKAASSGKGSAKNGGKSPG
jgi:hypothetical protein